MLLTIFLYGGELLRGGTFLHRSIFAPVINEEKRTNRMLTRKIEATEKKVDSTEQALDRFSAAISEYAQHLASHTSAVQGLAEASHELKRGAAEQNRVLMSFARNMGQFQEKAPEKPPAPEPKPATETPRPFHGALNKPVPPGCARKQPESAPKAPAKEKARPLSTGSGTGRS